jgi:N utilization substance protein A
MTKEIMMLIEQLSREKGISKEVLLSAIEAALLSAAKKKYPDKNVELRFEKERGLMELFDVKEVVAEIEDPMAQMSLAEAQKIDDEAEVGDVIELPLDFTGFGRIAAQTAKQVIFQRVREAERDVIFNEFKDKVGQIVSGTVMRKEKNVYFVNIGKAEAALVQRDTLPGETLKRGDIIRAIVEEIKPSVKGPMVHLSRTSPQFVAALFRMEVPEISEGLVVIKQVVREPGERTKIAVYSTNSAVDPVGACVGMKGTRVQAIVRELKGERIDIIPWNDDLRMLIARALSPAQIERVGIVEEEKTAMVVVGDQQLSIAIGKKGQNVRLAMKLTGWDIDILSESEYSKIKMQEADKALSDTMKPETATDKTETPAEPSGAEGAEGAEEPAAEALRQAQDSED